MNSHLIICKEKHKKDNEETDEKLLLYNKVEQLKNENNKLKESKDNKQESKEIIYEKSESVMEIFKKNHAKIEKLIDIIELDEYKYDDIDVITVTLCKNGKKIMKDKLDQDRSTFELLNLKDQIVIFPMILKEKSKKIIAKEIQPLVINDYSLVYRQADGYVDVTNLCKAGGKKYNDWYRLEKTQSFLKELSCVAGYPATHLVSSIQGGKAENQGTWAHPQVAINIAQWISPIFDVKVSKWVFELMLNGKVELGNEKTNEELTNIYKEKITTLTQELETNKEQLTTITTELETNKEQYHLLLKKHNSSLKNHRYIKFKENDPCFYIIDSGVVCDDCGKTNIQFKFGIAGTDEKNTIDDRLQSHRTLWPLLKVRFLLFIKDVEMIEKSFKMMYEKEINPNGHEIIENVELTSMIDRLKQLFDVLCLTNYHIMSDEKLKEYNDYVDTTIKSKQY